MMEKYFAIKYYAEVAGIMTACIILSVIFLVKVYDFYDDLKHKRKKARR